MKTTIEIQDELLDRAKTHAKRTGRTLRSLVEDGLLQVLAQDGPGERYKLPDLSVGGPEGPDPLASYSWEALRDVIYDDRSNQ